MPGYQQLYEIVEFPEMNMKSRDLLTFRWFHNADLKTKSPDGRIIATAAQKSDPDVSYHMCREVRQDVEIDRLSQFDDDRFSQTTLSDSPTHNNSGIGRFRTLFACLLITASLGLVGFGVTAPNTKIIPIIDVELGMRVAGQNADRTEVDLSIPDVDQKTWRQIDLQMTKENGDSLTVQLLRPLEWIEWQDASPGSTVWLDLPEMGAQGDAKVVSIRDCPPIQKGRGNVVTGRFLHSAKDNLLNVSLEGSDEQIGVTETHPFWSEDRKDYIPAGELTVGETVRTEHGLRRIGKILPRPRDEPVYNLEVHREHVYLVGSAGTLVHNSCGNRLGSIDDLANKLDDDVFFHYTDKAGHDNILETMQVRPDSKRHVFLTQDTLNSTEAHNKLFLGLDSHKGRGDYLFAFKLKNGSVVPGPKNDELIHSGTIRLEDLEFFFADLNPF